MAAALAEIEAYQHPAIRGPFEDRRGTEWDLMELSKKTVPKINTGLRSIWFPNSCRLRTLNFGRGGLRKMRTWEPGRFRVLSFLRRPVAGAAQPRQVRKFVSVLFCDLTGSTALGDRTDPEALRAVMRRYYDNARAVLERHGGTVEKFVGDAVMAVFGIPVATEDDALRAVRAAVELRDAVQDLGLEARIGVNTGEVVAVEGDTLVIGDAVNVAARLEQSAAPGDRAAGRDDRESRA